MGRPLYLFTRFHTIIYDTPWLVLSNADKFSVYLLRTEGYSEPRNVLIIISACCSSDLFVLTAEEIVIINPIFHTTLPSSLLSDQNNPLRSE